MSAEDKLSTVDDVQIDDGKFKYILIKISDGNKGISKLIVRGSASAEFHDNIYDEAVIPLKKLGLQYECDGGGKIQHDPEAKTIHVYGTSQGFGKADHATTVELLRKKFPDYQKIDYSNPDSEK